MFHNIIYLYSKVLFSKNLKVFRFCYGTLRISLNMNIFRHPVTQIKQDVSETRSLPVHRRKYMEVPTPPGLTQKNTVSIGVSN
jgi:hypothetical protein